MNNSKEQALKSKIMQIAKTKGYSFNQAWQVLVLERFLARLSRSKYRNQLIFKGGMLLNYYLKLGRETRDLDFLLKQIANEESLIVEIVNEINLVDLSDGFKFELSKIEKVSHLLTNYPGFSINLNASCSNIKSKINLDIGVGDIVSDETLSIQLSKTDKGAIFEDEISLLVYPPESIFAEKLETACFRGLENSRMKDFHDLWAMAVADTAILKDMKKLQKVLQDTFAHRGTKLQLIHAEVEGDFQKQELYWQSHLKKLSKSDRENNLPQSFQNLIQEMNSWLSVNLEIH